MKKTLTALLVLALMAGASAEIRLINGTGKALKVDVLSKAAQVRDVDLPADRSLSKVLGGKLDANRDEVLVIKDANGKELERTNAQTNCVFAINNWGSGVSLTYMGKFQGRKSDSSRLNFINATGKKLQYKFEYEDFSVYEGKSRDLNDQHGVEADHTGHSKSEGEKANASISGAGVGTLSTEVEVGALYILTDGGGSIKMERIW